MKKEVIVIFILIDLEIREVLYDVFVRKMKEKGFNVFFLL